jgi:hypothetical protein
VEEYTFIQPTDSKYDYRARGKTPVTIVAVIVDDRVFGVYRVEGIEKEGSTYSLASAAHREFDIEREKPDRPARRFRMTALPSRAVGAAVTGWEGRQRTPVARSGQALFARIEVRPTREAPVDVEASDLSDRDIEAAILDGRLRFGMVETSTPEALTRQRRGQDVLRKLTLQNYGNRCAVCDVSDPQLLRASHVVGWAERAETRGDLGNVMCLCAFHDCLFENGYWSLDDQLRVVVRPEVSCETIRQLLPNGLVFRNPAPHPIRAEFLLHHRDKHELLASSEEA